jgi:hypothetical protein
MKRLRWKKQKRFWPKKNILKSKKKRSRQRKRKIKRVGKLQHQRPKIPKKQPKSRKKG